MAQRQFPCPKCGAGIMVPDDYFRAQIGCAHCGTAVDRRTGALPGAAATANPYPAGQPFPQQRGPASPAPLVYPGYGPQYPPQYPAQYPMQYPMQYPPQYPPRKSGSRGLVIGLVIGGVVLLVVVVLALAAIPLITSGGIDDSGPWHHYRSEKGRFEIDFPQPPTENSQPMQMQHASATMYRATCTGFAINFEASYFDLGTGPTTDYEYDYAEGARAVANSAKGRIQSQNSRSVGNHKGSVAIVDLPNDRRTTMFMVRVGNRVYVVAVENHLADKQDVADRFIDGFKLIADGGNAARAIGPMAPYRRVGNRWMHKSTMNLQGMDPMVSFVGYEVLSVTGETANVRMTTYDGKRQQTYQSDQAIGISQQGVSGSAPSADHTDQIKTMETITVEGGTFACEKLVGEHGVTTWFCRKTGLIVRLEANTAATKTVTELVETNIPH